MLRCASCGKGYPYESVAAGTFCPDTLVCKECYDVMAELPYSQSCFGKRTVVDSAGVKKPLGYDPAAIECTKLCPDRQVCRNYVLGVRIASTLVEVP